ncbi:PEP-CTERM sorting domain-containing protein [Akkermansiaceae bacterium]|nr:PEP-CTERM sorting domain-containing protein [Akkermansiaceae bacterium]
MKNITLSLLGVTLSVASAATYSTSFDGFTAGDIQGQDNWVAQGQWDTDGAGNLSNTNGAFVRAHNTSVLGTTAIGEVSTIVTSFSLTAFTTPSGDIAIFEEGILQQGLSHQQGSAAFAYGIASGLFYEVSSGNLVIRANQGVETGGTSTATIGLASALGLSSWQMTSVYTKTAAATYSVMTSLDNTGDADPAFSISYTATVSADLDTDSDGGGLIGGIQALPSSGGSGGVVTPPFGSTTVSDYSFDVVSVPEPSSAALAALAVLGLLKRRR